MSCSPAALGNSGAAEAHNDRVSLPDATEEPIRDGYVVVSHQDAEIEDLPSTTSTQVRDPQAVASSAHQQAWTTSLIRASAIHLHSLRDERAACQATANKEAATQQMYCDNIISTLEDAVNVLQFVDQATETAEASGQPQLDRFKTLLIEQKEVVSRAESSLARIDTRILNEENELFALIERVGFHIDGMESTSIFDEHTDNEDAVSETSSCAPSIVRECFDALQNENVAKERLLEHEAAYQEEKAARDSKLSLGLTVDSTEAFEQEYHIKRQMLQDDFELAASVSAKARQACLTQGHDLEAYRWRRLS